MASQPQHPTYPPHVISYITREVKRRTEYKATLEQMPEYMGYDDFKLRRNQEQRKMLQSAIDRLTTDIIAICQKHFPDVEIDPNQEVTISNVLASLPMPEEMKRIRVISSRLGAPS